MPRETRLNGNPDSADLQWMPHRSAPTPPLRPRSELNGFSQVVDTIHDRFDRYGAAGVLLIQTPMLEPIENDHGHEARVKALAAFGDLLFEVGQERLDIDDLVVSGEMGRNEVLVFLFREHRDGRFYRQELPGFEHALRKALEQRATKVFYPYLRRVEAIATGIGVALRNPKLSLETQLHKAVTMARDDADLNAKIAVRRQRRRMLEVVLDRRVTSVYEPIVDVSTRTVFGYEALARGPQGTDLHAPMALFHLAEREDLVFELDCLCRASGLEGAIDYPEGTKLFLNIRPTTIHDPNFRAARLIETLARCQLAPSDVVFEVSEQESIGNMEAFLEIRDSYRDLGFQMALDDVGAGYAGLEALLALTPEFIKIDRSFVSGVDKDPARQDMLSAMRAVADRSGARIIGEGLDTLEELEMLGELGIDFGQGWLFGKPTPLRARD